MKIRLHQKDSNKFFTILHLFVNEDGKHGARTDFHDFRKYFYHLQTRTSKIYSAHCKPRCARFYAKFEQSFANNSF